MTFLSLAIVAVAVMASACWASNVWPGNSTWHRAAVGRALWWALPFGSIVWMNGAPLGNAAILAGAAWLGSWVPHEAVPDKRDHWVLVMGQAGIYVCRALVVLSGPAAVFLWCGAYWPAMLWAAIWSGPCMHVASDLPHGWLGFRDPQQVTGVLFGACVGFWLSVAVWAPEGNAPDFLP